MARVWVSEQGGRVWVFNQTNPYHTAVSESLDITDRVSSGGSKRGCWVWR